jgi:hypothetical protein
LIGIYGANGCLITSDSTAGLLTTDGVTYTAVTLPAASINGAAGNGFYFLAAFSTGYKSIDGLNFVSVSLPMSVQQVSPHLPVFAYGNGVFLYVQDSSGGGATVKSGFSTADGLTYTSVTGVAANSAGDGHRI